MKDTKEVVLFFKHNTVYKPLDVAKELSNRYEELGNPLILPETANKKNPLIVFNENKDFQIQANLLTFTIVVNHNCFERLASIIFDVVDTLNEFGCSFVRIGYISSVFLPPRCVDIAKERFLRMDYIEDVTDFNLSWYKKIDTKYGAINSWERFITDSANFDDLLCQYDFNSPAKEEVDFNMKYIKEFLKVADSYIADRTDF